MNHSRLCKEPMAQSMKTNQTHEKEQEEKETEADPHSNQRVHVHPMTIYLKLTKTVALRVKESESIGSIKSLLHDKEGIPECLQQIFSKDVRLTDEQKLVDYGIAKNSTLHAHIDNSVAMKLIVMRHYPKGAFTVYSRISDTIQDVKYRIGTKEGVKSKEFSLVHDGKFLEDDKTLAFYRISSSSMLHMVSNPRDKLCISVVMPTKEILQVEVKAGLTVRDIKAIIESRVCCSLDSMDLFYGIQKLDDLKPLLYQCDIKDESVLQVKRETIQIFIRKGEGSTILDVHKHELVKNVKHMLLERLQIPVYLQKLLFEGKILADSRDLASYNITMNSNINFGVRNCGYYEHPEDIFNSVAHFEDVHQERTKTTL